jgi:hypothetical protein
VSGESCLPAFQALFDPALATIKLLVHATLAFLNPLNYATMLRLKAFTHSGLLAFVIHIFIIAVDTII